MHRVQNLFCRKVKFIFIFLVFLAPMAANAQLVKLDLIPHLSSGIVTPMGSINTIEVVQFKVVDMDLEKSEQILHELSKYDGDIIGFGKSILDSKIIVSYTNPFTANHILAILDRVNIKAYYEVNGQNVYFVKNEISFFIR